VTVHKWILRHFGDTESDLIGRLYDPLQRLACFFTGHTPERDHCMRPEHDFCLWCHKPMPNTWVKP
jgi:hypothetical protein